MRDFDKNLVNILCDLKENHNVIGVKTEFETEGTSFDEAEKLGNLVELTNLNYTIKIGGCGALNDLLQAKKLNASTIVAPMVETEYALKKFIQTIQMVYSEKELQNINLFINIETITGYNNLQEIIKTKDFKHINGIVLGRNDLVSSMLLDKSEVNSNTMVKIANTIAKEMENFDKTLIIGGCVDENSIDFFKQINSTTFSAFETRKIIFKKNDSIKRESILKAIEFEIYWLKNKTVKNNIDIQRINHLENIFGIIN
ncbi:MAG: hypothetical protein IJY61_07100 [Candidatus Gastranaerophilales bacterium]|nr:hypothetical protein [Candidatus Gastranaerophilales bacterium]